MSVVAIIPARGGSKGIPRKNMADLSGQPLVTYSIKAAQCASLIDYVVVSTDDEEIAELSVSMGCIFPGLRPMSISGDTSTIDLAIDHAVSGLGKIGIAPKAIVTLYPTSPFRPNGLIDTLTQKLLEGHSPVFVIKSEAYPADGCFINSDGKLVPLINGIDSEAAKSVSYASRTGLFYGYLCGHVAYSAPYVHMVDDPIANIDIDEPEDITLARKIVSSGMYNLEGKRSW